MSDSGIPASAYTSNGIALTAPVSWFANSANPVFSDSTGGGTASSRDPAGIGGVQMKIANWKLCSAFVAPAGATPVPTLGESTLALLGIATVAVGARRLRRHFRPTAGT